MEIIRLAGRDDLKGLLSLYRELRPKDPELPAEIALRRMDELLANSYTHLIVVEADQQLIASCMLGLIPTLTNGGRPVAMIEHVITANACRGKGIGSKMLRFAIELAWSKDCYKVMLLSGVQRVDAHRVYEKLGFRGDIEKGYALKPDWYDQAR